MNIAQRSSKNNQLISNITSLLEETRSNLTSLSSNFNQEIQAIHNNISMISGSVHDLKRQISFFAKLSRSVRITKRHQTVVYDLAQTNNENGYNPKNGIFTCPQSGTYVFMWNTLIYVRTYIRLEIVVSGTALYGILEDTEEAGDYDSATGSVIVNLNVGDKVFIRSRDSGPGPLYLDSSIVTSSFSGYRI
ncbi:collagen alpha-2(VIII) chain-like [Saccostrea cucullata]|uniref:collagen alpha-2(VIII) chain-like n=1 Tax=Saccostrea cuccullata TaxID=36930 RepID=UPI002ED1C409